MRDALSTALYGVYACFHPFSGFWEIKHRRKNSLGAALIVLFFLCLAIVAKLQLTDFIFATGKPEDNNIFTELLFILIPLAMWVVVNWAITTLFEGKATMKVILITTINALIPMILLFIPQILLSYYFTLEENVFYVAIETLAIIWSVWNLMAGLSAVQDYGLVKTFATTLFTLIAMVAIVFLFAVFYSSLQQFVGFVLTVYEEIRYILI